MEGLDPRPTVTRSIVTLVLASALLLAACSAASDVGEPVPADAWEIDNFLYQLQEATAEHIGDTAFDLVITTIDVAGNSAKTVPTLKHSAGGDKTVLAYLSIGQAEDYRYYWDPTWKDNPPPWLDTGDSNWQGDYWVRYWQPAWQQLIYGSPDSYLDRIIELGFDGVYLDRIDAYVFFEDRDGRNTAAREMGDFVLDLTEYARQRRPGFGVFPQNEPELGLMFPEYLDAMTGIGIEDLYYGGIRDHEPSPASWTREQEANLRVWADAGKLVLTVDYTARPEQIADAYKRSLAAGFVPYVTDRSLGRIRINAGFEPDRQPSDYDYSVGY